MLNYQIKKNEQFNSNEIYFNSRPSAEVLANIKALKMRWNSVKKCWYGFASIEALTAAIEGKTPAQKKEEKKNNNINYDLSNLDQIKKDCWGSEFAAVIREELKKRGVKGASVRASKCTHTDSFTVTLKMASEDFRSIEELKERLGYAYILEMANYYNGKLYLNNRFYDREELCNDWNGSQELANEYFKQMIECGRAGYTGLQGDLKREDFQILTDEAFKRVYAAHKILNAANFDKSDSMTDYFCVGYYSDVKFKLENVTAREKMTEEERSQLIKEQEEEQARIEDEERRCQEEQKAREAEAEARRKEEEKDSKLINSTARVTDLKDNEKYYIYNLVGGLGKECNEAELKETLERTKTEYKKVEITREIDLNRDAFAAFNKYYLNDFDFLRGFGGYLWDDEKNEIIEHKNCIAIYCDDVLRLVIDPEGYSYARYVMITTDSTTDSRKQPRADIEQILRAYGLQSDPR